jgi:hypothetical protein
MQIETGDESMKPIKIATAALLVIGFLFMKDVLAQTYQDWGQNKNVTPVQTIPFPYTPLAPGQYGVTPTSATALTLPTGARVAVICASTASVRYTTDGSTTPTSSVGVQIPASTCIELTGSAVLANFKAISATGSLDVEFFK